MAVARAKGKLRGKQPKHTTRQQRELVRMHNTGKYSKADLAELFTASRATVYRVLERHRSLTRRGTPIVVFALEATANPDFARRLTIVRL